MKKEFVPYYLAVQLKDLGFNEECLGSFTIEDNSLQIVDMYNLPSVVKAPLWEQAFDWLLWKLKHISIDVIYSTAGCELIVEKQKINQHDTKEECLEKLIELCEKN